MEKKSLLCCLILFFLILNSANGEIENNQSKDFLKAYPSFREKMLSPEFIVEYKNEGSEVVDIAEFYAKESVVLDGKEYPRLLVKWGGNSSLSPGQSWTHTVILYEFLPGAIVEGKIQKLPLSQGMHTLIINYAGKESKPIIFEWRVVTELRE